MKDVINIRMIFPNDPTMNLSVHQMFFAIKEGTMLEFYSISTIYGRSYRLLGKDKHNYCQIIGSDQVENGFNAPSFIDCAKGYSVNVEKIDLNRLHGRDITPNLRDKILENVRWCKRQGVHVLYSINEDDLKAWNNKL